MNPWTSSPQAALYQHRVAHTSRLEVCFLLKNQYYVLIKGALVPSVRIWTHVPASESQERLSHSRHRCKNNDVNALELCLVALQMSNTQWLAPVCCSKSAQRRLPANSCAMLSGRKRGVQSELPRKPWPVYTRGLTVSRRLKSPTALQKGPDSHQGPDTRVSEKSRTKNVRVDASNGATTPVPQSSQNKGSHFDENSSSRACLLYTSDAADE